MNNKIELIGPALYCWWSSISLESLNTYQKPWTDDEEYDYSLFEDTVESQTCGKLLEPLEETLLA